MTASNREASISETLHYEGGFVNNKHDPGGATNYGITIIDARRYWKPDATPEDVKNMPKEVAVEIYRKKYWAAMGCDDRATGPDFVDFDFGVNSGVRRVAALRKKLDPLFLQPVAYVKRACAYRSSFLHSLKTFQFFGKGWSKRVANVEAKGVRMALGAAGKPVAPHLQKEAQIHTARSVTHTALAVGGASLLPQLAHHVDLSGPGAFLLGLGAALGLTYFIWHAVHAAHRSNAYKAQLK